MVVNDEEMKVLDDEMFNKEEIKNEEENTIIDESDKLFKFHQDFALGVNFNPNDPSIFCSVSGDSLAALWDINKKVPHLILKGHTDTINFCNYNYDGSLLATGSLDGSIRIWEANTGKLKHILEGPSDEIRVKNFLFYF